MIAYRALRKRPAGSKRIAAAPSPPLKLRLEPQVAEPPAYSPTEYAAIHNECFQLAFGAARFDYQILGEHAAVLQRVNAAVAESVQQRDYFPRRPLLLPKLLQALNDDDSTRQELVRLILEDPSLAGSVLQRANSAFYRMSGEPVESLHRAVVLLGSEGLRSLLATAILQPVFRVPKGLFESFATITWEQAQRTAVAAETYAKTSLSCDPFVAQLLGVLAALARIVLFRLTMEKYRESPSVLPRPEVFVRVMRQHETRVAVLVASTWELSATSLSALTEQANAVAAPPSALGRAIYFGGLCGSLALLAARSRRDVQLAQAMLTAQGLAQASAASMWQAALAVTQDR